MKSGPRLPQLEKALVQKRRPNTAINLKKTKTKKTYRLEVYWLEKWYSSVRWVSHSTSWLMITFCHLVFAISLRWQFWSSSEHQVLHLRQIYFDGWIPPVNHRTLSFPTTLALHINVHQNDQETFPKIGITRPCTKTWAKLPRVRAHKNCSVLLGP